MSLAAAVRAGLIDEHAIVTHPVLVGGTPFLTALDTWVQLSLAETRTFPAGVLLTRHETGRRVPNGGSVRAPGHPGIAGGCVPRRP